MNKKEEIYFKVERSWVKNLGTDDIKPGEYINISTLTKAIKEGMLVFVTENEKNYITYYKKGMKGNIYMILAVKNKTGYY